MDTATAHAHLISVVTSLPTQASAQEFHNAFSQGMKNLGWCVRNEVSTYVRVLGKVGRVDSLCSWKGYHVGVELDRRSPREKSVLKLEALEANLKVIILRDPIEDFSPEEIGVDLILSPSKPSHHQ